MHVWNVSSGMATTCQRGRSSATLSVITAVAVIVIIDLVFPVPTIATTRRGGNEAKRDHCNKTVDIYEDVSTPAPTPDTVGKPLTCWYRFRSFRGTPRDWILRIRFKKFKVGTLLNATHCQGGYMQIVDGNAKTDVSNRRDIGLFCGESEQPQTFISETSFVRVLFHTDNFTDQTYLSFDSRAEQQLEVYLRYGQHPELYPNRRGEVVAGGYCERVFRDCRLQTCYVQSPAYPGVYPRGLHCRYHLNTRLPFIKLYIENEEFNVDGQRCENIMTCPMRPIVSGPHHCPYDFLRVFDGRDEGAPLIGTFCGTGKFPYSIIGTSEDLFVEFVSSPAGPLLNTGFHFNVGNWPGHVDTAGSRNGTCDWVLTAEALEASGDAYGIFLSVAHWYPAHTSCTYLMRGRPGEIVRLYFPSFRVNRVEAAIEPWDGDCAESLTLYDADRPDDARIIKTFCDTFSRPLEKHDFVSSGSSLFVRFESKTGSYSGSSLYYWAHYDFFNNTASGERVTGTACDELFASWRHQEGHLRSPMNTLVYKQPQGVRCMYRFVTDRRLFARVILTVETITLKEHPYQTASCQSCWVDRVDKVIIYEPSAPGSIHNTTTPLACMCKQPPTALPQTPLILVSASDRLTLELQVEATHAAAAYFKHVEPLFEARYSFVHPPLCGPSVLDPATDGELRFPHYEALGYLDPPSSVHCIWELKVNRERDLWLHFDKVRFATRPCSDGILEVRLGGFGADWTSHVGVPYAKACGENVSALKEVPIISSAELAAAVPSWSTPEHLSVRIEFIGTVSPARASFRIAWTELFHLPRNPDGTLATARRTQDCEFACPGDAGLCIPRSLVCNGHVNCPNITSATAGTLTTAESGVPGVIAAVSDESPELCARTESPLGANWLAIGLGAAGGVVLALSCVIILCRLCCHKRHADDQLSVPY